MDGHTFWGFKILTTIHCHYKAWKRQVIFYIIMIIFVWKKKVIYTPPYTILPIRRIMFLERFPWAWFETEWNADQCVSSILSSQIYSLQRSVLVSKSQSQIADFGQSELTDFTEKCVMSDGQRLWMFILMLWVHQFRGYQTCLIFCANFRTPCF